MILYLVRHGETESNRLGLALGRADVPLNERGLAQTKRIAESLAGEPIEAVYASPLSRTMRLAEMIAEKRGLRAQAKPALIEMSIGEADGLTFAEVRSRFPGLLETWASDEGPKQMMPGG